MHSIMTQSAEGGPVWHYTATIRQCSPRAGQFGTTRLPYVSAVRGRASLALHGYHTSVQSEGGPVWHYTATIRQCSPRAGQFGTTRLPYVSAVRGRASLALHDYHTSVQSEGGPVWHYTATIRQCSQTKECMLSSVKYELNNTMDHAVVEASPLVLSTALATAVRPS